MKWKTSVFIIQNVKLGLQSHTYPQKAIFDAPSQKICTQKFKTVYIKDPELKRLNQY